MDGVATPIIGRPRPLPGHDTPNPAYHPHTLNYEEPHNISPGTSWAAKLSDLVHDYYERLALRSVAEMGFPPDWAGSFIHL